MCSLPGKKVMTPWACFSFLSWNNLPVSDIRKVCPGPSLFMWSLICFLNVKLNSSSPTACEIISHPVLWPFNKSHHGTEFKETLWMLATLKRPVQIQFKSFLGWSLLPLIWFPLLTPVCKNKYQNIFRIFLEQDDKPKNSNPLSDHHAANTYCKELYCPFHSQTQFPLVSDPPVSTWKGLQ